jgi:hypothetical protein
VDADGNDLSEVDGYDVSRTYKIQDDKLLSVLTGITRYDILTCDISLNPAMSEPHSKVYLKPLTNYTL